MPVSSPDDLIFQASYDIGERVAGALAHAVRQVTVGIPESGGFSRL
jgi:hypothetical protein